MHGVDVSVPCAPDSNTLSVFYATGTNTPLCYMHHIQTHTDTYRHIHAVKQSASCPPAMH